MYLDIETSRSLPRPPFVGTEQLGIHNFRDIGGYPIENKPTLSFRRNLFFRSSEPSGITPEGEDRIRSLRIDTIFDIRTGFEISQSSNDPNKKSTDDSKPLSTEIKDIAGVKRHHIDLTDPAIGDVVSLDKYKSVPKFTTERFVAKLTPFLDHGGAFRPVFEHLLQPHPSPFLIHCTAGKDRTGLLIMLFQSLAGVPPELIVEEYALSDHGMRALRPDLVKKLTRNPDMAMPEDWANNLVLSKREFMQRLLEILESEYGGVEKYLRDYFGLGTEELQRIRGNLVVEEKPLFAADVRRESRWWEQSRVMVGLAIGCGFSFVVLNAMLPQRVSWS